MKIGINKKLMAVTVAGTLLVAVFIGWSYYVIERLHGAVGEMDTISRRVEITGELDFNLQKLVRTAGDYLITGDLAKSDEFDDVIMKLSGILHELEGHTGSEEWNATASKVREGTMRLGERAAEAMFIEDPVGNPEAAVVMAGVTSYADGVLGTAAEFHRLAEADRKSMRSDAQRSARQTRTFLYILSSMVPVMFVLLYLYQRKFITRPILALNTGAEKISEGDFDHRVRVRTGDELEDLGEGFNKMGESLKDIFTEHKRAEEALRYSEKRFRTFIETSSESICNLDLKGRFIYMSPSGLADYGLSERDISGMHGTKLAMPDYSLLLGKTVEKAKKGETVRFEYESETLKGIRWFDAVLRPIRNDAGEVESLLWISRDITEQKLSVEKQRHHVEHVNALRTIDMAITGSLDLHLTLNVFIDQLASLLGVDAVCVLLLEHAGSKGFKLGSILESALRVGEGCAGRVALSRKVLVIRDLADSAEKFIRTSVIEEEGFRSYVGVPLIAKGQVKGVLEIFQRSTLEAHPEWMELLKGLATQAAIAIDNAVMFDDLQRSRDEIVRAYDTTLEGWSRALDYRDKETEGHSKRVTDLTLRIAKEMGTSDSEMVHIRRGALLHDIGKLGVPDSILLKTDKLTDNEWEIMRKHPEIAYELLSHIHYLRPAINIPYCHHEKWDGGGYPRGVDGERIPLEARIFALADVWDALISDRPYRAAWPEEKAMAHIESLSGSHLDPKVVDVFTAMTA
jgi:PAS domain S-box-containing protein/putative nucleotidyltransferase with HDIG domain